MKNRHFFLILKVNEIWKLEKAKGELRERQLYLSREISLGKKQVGKKEYYYSYGDDSWGNASGTITTNLKTKEDVANQIKDIREKQIKLWEEVKNYFKII